MKTTAPFPTVEHANAAFDSILAKTADVLGITPDEVRRRARLAGAAQELYNALQEAIVWWDDRKPDYYYIPTGEDPIKPWRDAIAKAEGR